MLLPNERFLRSSMLARVLRHSISLPQALFWRFALAPGALFSDFPQALNEHAHSGGLVRMDLELFRLLPD